MTLAFLPPDPAAPSELSLRVPSYFEDAAWRNATFLVWAGALAVAFLVACGWCVAAVPGARALPLLQHAYSGVLPALMALLLFRQGGVDLSVPVVIGLSATVFGALVEDQAASVPLAVGACLAMAALIGLWHGAAVGLLRLPGFLVTLPTIPIARALAYAASDEGQPMGLHLDGALAGALTRAAPLVGWGLSLALLAAGLLLAQFPPGGDRPSRPVSPARRALALGLPYVGSSAVAAMAGVLLVCRTQGATISYGTGADQDAIVALVLGGAWLAGRRANCLGVLFAALLLRALDLGSSLAGVSPSLTMALKGALGIAGLGFGLLVHWVIGAVHAGRPGAGMPGSPPAA